MKKTKLCLLLAFALWLPAGLAGAMCADPGDPPGGTEFDVCVESADADISWRYLARDSGGAVCPDAAGWSEGKFFGDGEIPPGLSDICLYEALGMASDVEAINALACGTGGAPPNCLSDITADSMSLTMLSSQAIEGLIVNDFSAQFLAQTGATGPLPAAPQNVRIAIVDTEPTGFGQDRDGPGIAEHGFSLINLMRGLACPAAGNCGTQLRSELGLPLQLCSTDPGASCPCSGAPITGVCANPAVGGYVGTQSDLALAIYEAVVSWESTSVQRLVINLSVGWEPVFGGQPPISGVSLPAQAVALALQYASCNGALVIAAAGNRVPGPQSISGPVYPAGWEEVAAPNLPACVALLGGPPDPTMFPVPGGAYRPLVYAVAAVDHEGDSVETRLNGEPRLVAFGDHAVTNTDIMGVIEPTATLTGSSVAAAVVSAAAAAAWYQRPAAPGYAIMQTLYNGAPSSPGRSVDFCLDGGSGCTPFDVRRVNVCEAIASVCSAIAGPACPTYACPTDVPVLAPVPTAALLAAFASDPVTDVSLFARSAIVPECGNAYLLHWDNGQQVPDVPCPHLQYYGVQVTPWTDGQPSGQACEGCIHNFASPGKLFLEVKAEFEETLEYLTLLCGDEAFRLPGTLQPGDRRLVVEIPTPCETREIGVAFRATRNGVHKASILAASLNVADRDDDGVQDAVDNCYKVANAPQRDTDGDSIGNYCDGDFNNNCIVNTIDLGYFRSVFFTTDPDADLNGDGIVNAVDLGLFKGLFFEIPGPSGIPNLCSP